MNISTELNMTACKVWAQLGFNPLSRIKTSYRVKNKMMYIRYELTASEAEKQRLIKAFAPEICAQMAQAIRDRQPEPNRFKFWFDRNKEATFPLELIYDRQAGTIKYVQVWSKKLDRVNELELRLEFVTGLIQK